MNNKLTKSRSDRVLFGVCGGLANYLGVDSVLLRIGFILGAIFTGSLLLWVYVILGIILPNEKNTISDR